MAPPPWLAGLGVWFALRMREVPGSNPGRAQFFFFFYSHIDPKLEFKIKLISIKTDNCRSPDSNLWIFSKHYKVKTFYISMMIWVCCDQYVLTIFFRQMELTNFISSQEKSQNMEKKRNIISNAIQHATGTFNTLLPSVFPSESSWESNNVEMVTA